MKKEGASAPFSLLKAYINDAEREMSNPKDVIPHFDSIVAACERAIRANREEKRDRKSVV